MTIVAPLLVLIFFVVLGWAGAALPIVFADDVDVRGPQANSWGALSWLGGVLGGVISW